MRRLDVVSVAAAMLLVISGAACSSAPIPTATSDYEPILVATSDDSPALVATAESQPTPETATATEGQLKKFEDFDPNNFDRSTNIDNEWLPLLPGTQFIYEGFTIDEDEIIPHRLVFTVTDLTKEIEGVRTVVAWIADYSAGELVEAEIAFYAQDTHGNVWYMGEYPEEYENGSFVAAPTWIHGLAGARAGIAMLADPKLSALSYSQGWGPAVDFTDRAKVDEIGQKTCVPIQCYEQVLAIAESSLTEVDAFQLKYFARGLGKIGVGWRGADATREELGLVEVNRLGPEALAQIHMQALELENHAYEVSQDVYGRTQPAE